jgi:hypothetical protein
MTYSTLCSSIAHRNGAVKVTDHLVLAARAMTFQATHISRTASHPCFPNAHTLRIWLYQLLGEPLCQGVNDPANPAH